MLRPGASREQLARTLNAAYADGLLSEKTLSYRLEELFGSALVDPVRLIGDLFRRGGGGRRSTLLDAWTTRLSTLRNTIVGKRRVADRPIILALDWTGLQEQLVVGRHHSCDVVLADPEVSRRHARLCFRDGRWVVRDLESTNGTIVNGGRIGRCELRPGDRLVFGSQQLQVD